jgi:hypothetical protein
VTIKKTSPTKPKPSRPKKSAATASTKSVRAPAAKKRPATVVKPGATTRKTTASKPAVGHKPRPKPAVKVPRGPSAEQIAEMIEEATVDAYGEEELATGWHCVIQDNLELPFTTEVLGIEVEVVDIDLTERNEIVAVCQRGKHTQRVLVLDLPLPDSPPEGAAWIEAYRQWGG